MIYLLDIFEEVNQKNLLIANMQKRLDRLRESLEDIEIEICLSRHDSAEKALNLIQKARENDKKYRSELKK